LSEMFGAHSSEIRIEARHFNFRYRSPDHFLNVFETYYGPIHRAIGSLDQQGQVELRNDLYALVVRSNRACDGTMKVPSEYLEVLITKR
jgi:hypothetical protein